MTNTKKTTGDQAYTALVITLNYLFSQNFIGVDVFVLVSCGVGVKYTIHHYQNAKCMNHKSSKQSNYYYFCFKTHVAILQCALFI